MDIIEEENSEESGIRQYERSTQERNNEADPSDSLIPVSTRETRRVPTPVFLAYFTIILLHGYIFYSVWWRIVPYVSYKMKTSTNIATCSAQGFLVVSYMAPIITGIMSDIRVTRYKIVLVSSVVFAFHYATQIALSTYWNLIPGEGHIYLIIIVLVFSATSIGISKGALIPFGLEQMSNDRDSIQRTSFVRWIMWTYELGRLAAYILIQYGNDSSSEHVTGMHFYTVLGASVLLPFLFVICRPWYKINLLVGYTTLKHLRKASKRCTTFRHDEDEDIPFASDSPERLHKYQRALLRKNIFLCLIFFSFGAYFCSYFLANIVYPFQIDEAGYQGPRYFTALSCAVVLLVIPILDCIVRCTGKFHSSLANFVAIGIGMVLATLSIAISTWGNSGTTEYSIRVAFQYVFNGLGEVCYYCSGYDMAYRESSRYLRGTTTGLYLGVPSFFGAIIFFCWYLIPPLGLHQQSWFTAQIMVSTVLVFSLICAYSPFVKWYLNAKKEVRNTRPDVEEQFRDHSMEYRSIQ